MFLRCRLINDTGVAILMVEQNARRCLQVVRSRLRARPGHERLHRLGRELLADPKVIELYLGTLAQGAAGGSSTRDDESAPSTEARAFARALRSVQSGRVTCRRRSSSPRALPMLPSTAVDLLVLRADALLDHRGRIFDDSSKPITTIASGIGGHDLVDLGVERSCAFGS